MCPFPLPTQIPGYVTANVNLKASFHYLYLCIALSTNAINQLGKKISQSKEK